MYKYILSEVEDNVGIITLNRPEVLNAWHKPMRDELIKILLDYNNKKEVKAIIMTGSGKRAFSAGQDLNEAIEFDEQAAEDWIEEWRNLYDVIRSLSKPLVIAINGVAAGSAFQVALLGDVRIGCPGIRMGQPEINSGILSITGPWIMREILGLSRTIELTLSGRLMEADECLHIGIIHKIVNRNELLIEAVKVAKNLGNKPPNAMRLIKKRFREVTESGFQEAMDAAVIYHREAYNSGEPQEYMKKFLEERRVKRKQNIFVNQRKELA